MRPVEFTSNCFPFIASPVYSTDAGTPYLKAPGVAMISRPQVDLSGTKDFFDGFADSLGFGNYLSDPTRLHDSDQLVKFSGQICYLSHDNKRTHNKDASRYIEHIKESSHGSVLEHSQFSFLIWGIDRAVTHELVRHRHSHFSQVSQRYVDGKKLRFVERPEYQIERISSGLRTSELSEIMLALHSDFIASVDSARLSYDERARLITMARGAGHPMFCSNYRTDSRKQTNQTARDQLPNCTEAPIVVSFNARELRNILEQRASASADSTIREMAIMLYLCVREIAPLLFSDYVPVDLPTSGTVALETPYKKI